MTRGFREAHSAKPSKEVTEERRVETALRSKLRGTDAPEGHKVLLADLPSVLTVFGLPGRSRVFVIGQRTTTQHYGKGPVKHRYHGVGLYYEVSTDGIMTLHQDSEAFGEGYVTDLEGKELSAKSIQRYLGIWRDRFVPRRDLTALGGR